MAMGMGGGFDSSGPQGLGADAFGGGRSNRIAFYMDDAFSKIGMTIKENPRYTAHKDNIRQQYLAWDPAAHLRKSMGVVPLSEQLQPGVYDLGEVHYEQLYDWGLMNQQRYDANTLLNDSKMYGKNFPMWEKPGVLEYNMPQVPSSQPNVITQDPLVNYSVPLNPAVPMNMEGLNPDLNSVPTGPGSYGWSR